MTQTGTDHPLERVPLPLRTQTVDYLTHMGHEHESGGSLAELLRAAMAAKGLSNRGLAVKLAGSTSDKDEIEKHRKTVRRILSGKQRIVQRETAERLAEILGTEVDYWPVSRATISSNATGLAEEMLRQLRAGAVLPAARVAEVADAIEETARYALGLAAELRSAGRVERTAP
jgi:transcriptional regulator with XRE-family HTH domain